MLVATKNVVSRLAPCSVALVGLSLFAAAGCSGWPWRHKDRTTFITPPMRVAAIREIGVRNRRLEVAKQQEACQQLAAQIRTEPDPIVRRAIQETVAEFKTPLADAILMAGLSDSDREVRIVCCRLIGERQTDAAVEKLCQMVSTDDDIDVRTSAVEALGHYKSDAAMRGLAAALKDRDPAMQYAGVLAMKSSTGEDLGNDVSAWRQYAESHSGDASPAASIARQPGDTTPR